MDPSTPLLEPERYELSEPRRYTFELERRDFIRLFGGGLVVMVAASDLLAQESGRARPSLSQTVADELRVPIASITMVMADTDKTPYDAGTFGSQTTPRMAPQLAKAAATAREMLIDQAAARWQIDRAALAARDGAIVANDGRAVSYGELTKGQALSGTIPASPAVEPPAKWRLRGASAKKVDGRAFVTGRHQYTPDIVRPGMLYGRVVRPDGYGGTLVSVDDAKARAMPGVAVVRDADFLGIVAPTGRAAARAASAIQTTWKVPAGQPSSETIYEYLKKNPDRGSTPAAVDTIQMPAGAVRTFEASYRIPYIAHTPLEPRAAVAEWQDGRLTVWTGTQSGRVPRNSPGRTSAPQA